MLEGNNIKDKACNILCEQLLQNQALKVLNLSNNNLTDKSVMGLSNVIYNCGNLVSLFVHYNKIFGKGGMVIAEML